MAAVRAVTCPRCVYDLTGQIESWRESCPLEGRCPECGLALAWGPVILRDLVPPKYSVEHAERPARAVFGALRAAVRPWALWRALRLEHALVTRRLWVVLAGVALAVFLSAGLVNLWRGEAQRVALARGGWSYAEEAGYSRLAAVLMPHVMTHPRWGAFPVVNHRIAPILMGVLLTPIAFACLTRTFARARVDRRHVLRLSAYWALPIPAVMLVLMLADAIADVGFNALLPTMPALLDLLLDVAGDGAVWLADRPYVVAVGLLGWSVGFFAIGMRRYLRLARLGSVLAGVLVPTAVSLAALVACGFWPGNPLLREVAVFFFGWR